MRSELKKNTNLDLSLYQLWI